MRTAIFAAFRSVWISSCEACLFIHTRGSAVQSHKDVAERGHKGLFMMHECKRLLNKQVAGHGLWHADLAKAQDRQDGEVAKVHGAGSNTDDGSDAAGAADRSDAEDDDAGTPIRTAQDIEDAAETGGTTRHTDVVAAEHTDSVEHADLGPHIADQSEHVKTGFVVSENESKAQIFQVTMSLRDDWLHRGDALQDMDLQTYAEYIERRRKPIRGDDCAKVLRDRIFAFDPHHKLAPGYMQMLLPANRRKIARFNMARSERDNVNEGEENAQFKAMHCTLLRCPGPGSCADPLMCAAALFPNAKGECRFSPAWRARESEIKILAGRGHEKKQKARRFEALHDTTLCKVLQSTAKSNPEEPLAPTKLQIELQRWFRQGLRHL